MRGSKFFLCVLVFFSVVACGNEGDTIEKSNLTTTVSSMKDEHKDATDVIDLSSVTDPPAVSVTAIPDSEGGVMLAIELENFELVPLETKNENQPQQGHLHVELDGMTVVMLSENHHHLSNLANGHHEIVVSLSAIDHRSYHFDGKPISDSVLVTIDGGEKAGSPDISFEVEVIGGTVTGGLPRFEVSKNDVVEIIVYSDQSDEVHLHVYNKMTKVEPGIPALIKLKANVPGIFEAELHSAGIPGSTFVILLYTCKWTSSL
jgi:hypothetical protein